MYQGEVVGHLETPWKNWSGFDLVCARTGLLNRAGERHHESFIRAMHNNAVFRAQDVIKAVDMGGVKKALDLGAAVPGPTAWKWRDRARTSRRDGPNTIVISKKLVKEAKVRNIDYLLVYFHSDDIGIWYLPRAHQPDFVFRCQRTSPSRS